MSHIYILLAEMVAIGQLSSRPLGFLAVKLNSKMDRITDIWTIVKWMDRKTDIYAIAKWTDTQICGQNDGHSEKSFLYIGYIERILVVTIFFLLVTYYIYR